MNFRAEMLDNGYSVMEEHLVSISEDRLVKREETKRFSTDVAELELPLEVKSASTPDCLAVGIRIRRMRTGYSYRDANGVGSDRFLDTASPPDANDPSAQDGWKERQDLLKTLRFSAAIDGSGGLLAFDASGGQFDSMKKEWAAKGDVPKEQAEEAIRFHSYGVENALSDALAYLPPGDANTGRTWQVVRAKVYPCHAYGFYMMTNGCGFSTEQSTCQVQSVEQTAEGRIATIRIAGRRVPQFLGAGRPPRVDYMETTGELRFNLDSRAILSLRVEARPHWIDSEDRRLMDILFVSVISLRRDRE